MVRIGSVQLEDCARKTVAEVGGIVGPAGHDETEAVRLLTDYLTAGLAIQEEDQLNEMLFELYAWGEGRTL